MVAVEERIRADLQAQLGFQVRDVRPIPEGHSSFTYWVDADGSRSVLRLPPPGVRVAGPADIPRQARILRALGDQGLPVPQVLFSSSDPVVDGRPFLLMEAVNGQRVEEAVRSLSPTGMAEAALRVLRRLQAVPVAQSGIADEAAVSPTDQVAYWARLLDRSPAELTSRAPQLRSRLEASLPAPTATVLVHGDFHYGNMLFRDGEVVALLDWEIAQLGPRELDPGCLCVAAEVVGEFPGSPRWQVSPGEVAAGLGLDAHEFGWYLALTYYKYAAIFGYNLMLHRRGKRPDPSYERRAPTVPRFLDRGLNVLDGGAAPLGGEA